MNTKHRMIFLGVPTLAAIAACSRQAAETAPMASSSSPTSIESNSVPKEGHLLYKVLSPDEQRQLNGLASQVGGNDIHVSQHNGTLQFSRAPVEAAAQKSEIPAMLNDADPSKPSFSVKLSPEAHDLLSARERQTGAVN